MKTISSALLFALVGLVSFCHAQEGFYYQAVLRNPDGSPLKNQEVTLELSIKTSDQLFYHEAHTLTTSENGLIHASFGSGDALTGSVETIDWSESLLLEEHIVVNGAPLLSSTKPILKTPRAYVADKALAMAPLSIRNAEVATDAQIAFEKLAITRSDIEGLGIIDTDTDTTYEVGDNGLTEKNFTSTLKSKLDNIEAGADKTDTANVVAALKAGTNITITTDGTISAAGGSSGTTYSIGDGGLTEKNFTSALNIKLDGIEAAADVTDTQNVVAALTAGSNITIAADGTISASDTDTTYSAGTGLTLTGTTLAIDNSVVTSNYLGTVTANAFIGDGSGLSGVQNLADDSVTNSKIADASITSAKIADGSITAGTIADAAITSAKIANGAISSSKMATQSVTSSKLADDSVTNSKIADASITSSKLDSSTNYQTGLSTTTLTTSTGYPLLAAQNLSNTNTVGASNTEAPIFIYGKGEMFNGADVTIPVTPYDLTSNSLVFITRTNENASNYRSTLYATVDAAEDNIIIKSMTGDTGAAATTFNFMIVNFDY